MLGTARSGPRLARARTPPASADGRSASLTRTGLVHGRDLVIPYAMSDYASSFATVNVDELLAELAGNQLLAKQVVQAI